MERKLIPDDLNPLNTGYLEEHTWAPRTGGTHVPSMQLASVWPALLQRPFYKPWLKAMRVLLWKLLVGLPLPLIPELLSNLSERINSKDQKAKRGKRGQANGI